MNFLAGFKKATHVIAGLGVLAVTWAMSEQGQSVIGGIVHAYPKFSGVVAVIGLIAALYHSPKAA